MYYVDFEIKFDRKKKLNCCNCYFDLIYLIVIVWLSTPNGHVTVHMTYGELLAKSQEQRLRNYDPPTNLPSKVTLQFFSFNNVLITCY